MVRRFWSIAAGIIVASFMLLGGVLEGEGTGARATSLISPIGDPIDGSTGASLGTSVAISADGDRVIVGAPASANFPGIPAGTNIDGSAQVFDNVNGQWSQVGGTLTRKTAGDRFGAAVSISANGSRIAVGAPDNGLSSGTGYVRVFELQGSSWVQMGGDMSGVNTGDEFGASVSLSADGSRLAVGSPGNDGSGGDNVGSTHIYDWDGNQWTPRATIYGAIDRDGAGESVSLSSDGTRVAIGSPSNDDGASFSGHVRIFEEAGNDWLRVGAPIAGVAADNYFGYSVSLSGDGNRVAAGAYGNDNDNGSFAGHTRVLDWDGSSWVPVGGEIIGEAANDQSGQSISLSADGTRLAVGAPTNTGNGTDAGHVRVFELVAGNWFQLQPDIHSLTPGDRFGFSVAMNATGSVLAAGGFLHGANNEGHVRVFSIAPFIPSTDQADTNTSDGTKNASLSSPGIFLTVPAKPGDSVSGVQLTFGAYAIAPASLYVVNIRQGDVGNQATVLSRGWVSSGGHLETQVLLPELGPGLHTVTLTAQGASGETLVLGNRISVSPNGTITNVTPESLQPSTR